MAPWDDCHGGGGGRDRFDDHDCRLLVVDSVLACFEGSVHEEDLN